MNKWWIQKLKGNDPVFIYILIDPITQGVFYVGKTRSKPQDRLNGHVSDAMRGNASKRSEHIRKILSQKSRPIVQVIETTNMKEYPSRERYWISVYKQQGCHLDNSDSGGGGML